MRVKFVLDIPIGECPLFFVVDLHFLSVSVLSVANKMYVPTIWQVVPQPFISKHPELGVINFTFLNIFDFMAHKLKYYVIIQSNKPLLGRIDGL